MARRSEELIQKMKRRRSRAVTLPGAIEKAPILEKNKFVRTFSISISMVHQYNFGLCARDDDIIPHFVIIRTYDVVYDDGTHFLHHSF